MPRWRRSSEVAEERGEDRRPRFTDTARKHLSSRPYFSSEVRARAMRSSLASPMEGLEASDMLCARLGARNRPFMDEHDAHSPATSRSATAGYGAIRAQPRASAPSVSKVDYSATLLLRPRPGFHLRSSKGRRHVGQLVMCQTARAAWSTARSRGGKWATAAVREGTSAAAGGSLQDSLGVSSGSIRLACKSKSSPRVATAGQCEIAHASRRSQRAAAAAAHYAVHNTRGRVRTTARSCRSRSSATTARHALQSTYGRYKNCSRGRRLRGLSEFALYYIRRDHSREGAERDHQSRNHSYRRLVPGFEARSTSRLGAQPSRASVFPT